jgi:hypothetical protein
MTKAIGIINTSAVMDVSTIQIITMAAIINSKHPKASKKPISYALGRGSTKSSTNMARIRIITVKPLPRVYIPYTLYV